MVNDRAVRLSAVWVREEPKWIESDGIKCLNSAVGQPDKYHAVRIGGRINRETRTRRHGLCDKCLTARFINFVDIGSCVDVQKIINNDGAAACIWAVTAAELSCPIQHGVVGDRRYGVVNNAVVKPVGAESRPLSVKIRVKIRIRFGSRQNSIDFNDFITLNRDIIRFMNACKAGLCNGVSITFTGDKTVGAVLVFRYGKARAVCNNKGYRIRRFRYKAHRCGRCLGKMKRIGALRGGIVFVADGDGDVFTAERGIKRNGDIWRVIKTFTVYKQIITAFVGSSFARGALEWSRNNNFGNTQRNSCIVVGPVSVIFNNAAVFIA